MDIANINGSSVSVDNYVDSKAVVNEEEKGKNNYDTVSLSSTNNNIINYMIF
ncbi:MAG: hypothetical protein ACERKZ_01110 [Lachnotalea sp.]